MSFRAPPCAGGGLQVGSMVIRRVLDLFRQNGMRRDHCNRAPPLPRAVDPAGGGWRAAALQWCQRARCYGRFAPGWQGAHYSMRGQPARMLGPCPMGKLAHAPWASRPTAVPPPCARVQAPSPPGGVVGEGADDAALPARLWKPACSTHHRDSVTNSPPALVRVPSASGKAWSLPLRQQEGAAILVQHRRLPAARAAVARRRPVEFDGAQANHSVGPRACKRTTQRAACLLLS
jgi:hypothetical protein